MKWITLISFVIALASMPATAQRPHPLKGVKLGKKDLSCDVSTFKDDRSGIASEWAKQQMLLALKANKFPFSEDFSPANYMLMWQLSRSGTTATAFFPMLGL
jgi:hypothetical protein